MTTIAGNIPHKNVASTTADVHVVFGGGAVVHELVDRNNTKIVITFVDCGVLEDGVESAVEVNAVSIRRYIGGGESKVVQPVGD